MGVSDRSSAVPLRALLVEDSAPDAALVRHLLGEHRAPLEVERAASLEEGLARLAAGAFDAILLDLSLPDAQGLDGLARVRAARPGLPVVVVTGLDDDRIGVEALQRGAQDYLVKGRWDGEQLARAIRHAVERQRIHDALRASEERYELVARAASDGIWDWDLAREEAYFSPRWSELLGWGPPGLRPVREWIAHVHPDDAGELEARLAACAEGSSDELHAEYRIRRRDGEWRWMANHGLAVRDGAERPARIAGLQRDVTARKREEERILHDVYHDPLTSLPNRTLLHERLSRCIARLRRDPARRFAVLFVDLDGFKQVNDGFGHLAGDHLLVDVARRLRDALRPQDTLARIGGDEFVVLAEDVEGEEDALRVAERVLSLLEGPFALHGRALAISGSIGVAVARADEEAAEAVLARADRALYRAKEMGRGRYELADDGGREGAPLETRAARGADELEIVFRPVVDAERREILRLQAVPRRPTPPGGAHILEEDGSPPQERWRAVLRAACTGIGAIRAAGSELGVAVQLPAGALARHGLEREVLDEAEAAGVQPDALHLVLSARDLEPGEGQSLETARALRAAGVHLRAGPVGGGAVPLAALAGLPLEALELDERIVREAARDAGALALARGLCGMAEGLGLACAATGIETEAEAELARSLGCAELAGGLAGAAETAEEAAAAAPARLKRGVLVPAPRAPRRESTPPRPSGAREPERRGR